MVSKVGPTIMALPSVVPAGASSLGRAVDSSACKGPLSGPVCKMLTTRGPSTLIRTTGVNHINDLTTTTRSTVSVPPGNGPVLTIRLSALLSVLTCSTGPIGGAPNPVGGSGGTIALSAAGHSV